MNVSMRQFMGERDWAWVNRQVPILRVEDTGGLIAFDMNTGKQLAACIWDNWTNTSVQCHMIIKNPIVIKHGFLNTIAEYIFEIKNKRFIYGLVPSDKVRALKLNKHMGFTEKFRLEDGFADGIDYVFMELKKENCPFLKAKAKAA